MVYNGSTVRLSVSDSSDKHTVFSAFLAFWYTPPVFGHRKSLRRISPTKAAFVLFSYCDYNTLVFDSQRDNVGHLRTFADIFKIFYAAVQSFGRTTLLNALSCQRRAVFSFTPIFAPICFHVILSVSMSFYECSDSEAPSVRHGFQPCLSQCEYPL